MTSLQESWSRPQHPMRTALTSMRFALAMAKTSGLRFKPLHPRQPPVPMKLPTSLLSLALAVLAPLASHATDSWRSLFNGRDLTGWKPNVYPDSWSVVDGTIRANATKESSHLFYVGSKSDGFEAFKDFELEIVARSEPNSNGGVFIHTGHATMSAALRLSKGYEVQLNSSQKEKKKTGSLYAIVDLDTSPVDETKWFTTLIKVQGKRITVTIDGKQVIDYTEPANAPRPKGREGRLLDAKGGAIALQAHDPGSTFYFRSIRLRPL
jgi:hypothetical protein